MPLLADRVLESTSTTGTGTFALGGALTGYRAFNSAFSNGDIVYYTADNGQGEWEVGYGTVGTGTLTRNVIESSNANALVDFSAGTKRLFCTAPAQQLPPNQTGNSGKVLSTDGSNLSWTTSAAGTVTSVSVSTANGFAGSSSGGATPALTLSTTVTGLLKGNGTAVSAASAGTDYVAVGGALGTPSSGTLTSCTGLPISTGVSGLGTGVATFLATPSSANLAAAVTDETGSGSLVFANSPTLITPTLGTPASGDLANCTFPTLNQNTTGTAAGLSTTLAIASGGTGQTTATAAFDALSPATTKGDLIVNNGTNDIRLAVGADTYILTADSAEASGLKWAVGGGGSTLQAVASGALSDGSTVVVNSDGTVSAVTAAAINPYTTNSPYSSVSSFIGTKSIVYNSAANVVVAFGTRTGDFYGIASVGVITGETITFGTPVVFYSGAISGVVATYNSTADRLVVMFRQDVSPYYPYAAVGSVSGTSLTFYSASSVASLNSTITKVISLSDNRICFVYNYYVRLAYVYTSSLGVGSASASMTPNLPGGCSYDPVANKLLVVGKNFSNNYAFARVVTPSGVSVSLGSVTYITGVNTNSANCDYDPFSGKTLITYVPNATEYATAVVGTISGTSISTATPVIYQSSSTTYYGAQSASVDMMMYANNTIYPTAISGTSISVGSGVGLPAVPGAMSNFLAYISNTTLAAFVTTDTGSSGAGTIDTASTNLTNSNYIGIANGAYTTGQTATIQIIGAVDDAQSGLTAGKAYYVSYNGALNSSPSYPSVIAGTAVTSSKLIVKG